MGLFLFRFWPVLLPFLAYILWLKVVGRKAEKEGRAKPLFREGPWYWLVFATLGMAFVCFVWLGATMDGNKGSYVPPHMEDGVMVQGVVKESR